MQLTQERREELKDIIGKMHKTSRWFYAQAVTIGNHAFIEFTGLMNEYIKMCQQTLEKGMDFTECNVHSGVPLVGYNYNFNYLAEKLGCITSTDVTVAGVEQLEEVQ